MKAIVIAAMACATAIICVLLRVERAPARYQLYGIDETSSGNGKTVKSVYRLDMISGRTWRVSSKPFVASGDLQHNPLVNWADGWEEMPESPEAAVAKAQAEWRHAAASQTIQPTASPAR
jgi:hypothetical protein